MDLFVYYDVALARVGGVREQVRALHEELDCNARLMKRSGADADHATWMEIYPDVDVAFAERLAAAVEHRGLVALTGPRHVECFDDVD